MEEQRHSAKDWIKFNPVRSTQKLVLPNLSKPLGCVCSECGFWTDKPSKGKCGKCYTRLRTAELKKRRKEFGF